MSGVRILETNIVHASDVIYWLDGASGETPAEMSRLERPVSITLSSRPMDLSFLPSPGKTAFFRKGAGLIVEGTADDEDKAYPAASPFDIDGTVFSIDGRYLPRTFRVTGGAGGAHPVVLYPSPLGTRFGKSGGLKGTVRRRSDTAPLPWALLTLTVTVSLERTLSFTAQTDRHGDFLLSLRALPPLPESIESYSALLAVRALATAAPSTPLNPDDLIPAQIGRLDIADSFEVSAPLEITPGAVRTIQTFEEDYLCVEPSSP